MLDWPGQYGKCGRPFLLHSNVILPTIAKMQKNVYRVRQNIGDLGSIKLRNVFRPISVLPKSLNCNMKSRNFVIPFTFSQVKEWKSPETPIIPLLGRSAQGWSNHRLFFFVIEPSAKAPPLWNEHACAGLARSGVVEEQWWHEATTSPGRPIGYEERPLDVFW